MSENLVDTVSAHCVAVATEYLAGELAEHGKEALGGPRQEVLARIIHKV
jgi:hypothetical protein